MSNIKKNLKIFKLMAQQAWKITFQARLGAVFFMVGKIVRVFFIFFFLAVIFSRTQIIKGYTFNQILLFYLTFNIIDTLSQILYREVYRFRPLVVSGGFDGVLLKPYHPFMKVLLGGIDYLDLLLVIPYIAAVIVIYLKSGPFNPLHLGLYFLFVANSLVLVTAFHIIVLALGIVTTEVDHTIMIYRDLTSMGRFPMDIYKEPVRGIFTYIIPVAVMMTVPSQALLGFLSPLFAVYSFLISLVLLFLSLRFWNYAVRRYQSWGG